MFGLRQYNSMSNFMKAVRIRLKIRISLHRIVTFPLLFVESSPHNPLSLAENMFESSWSSLPPSNGNSLIEQALDKDIKLRRNINMKFYKGSMARLAPFLAITYFTQRNENNVNAIFNSLVSVATI